MVTEHYFLAFLTKVVFVVVNHRNRNDNIAGNTIGMNEVANLASLARILFRQGTHAMFGEHFPQGG